jgi:hypothetical protein
LIEFSIDSNKILVGSSLFLHAKLSTFKKILNFKNWCMLGVGVDISTKNFLYWFIEGQINFGMPRGAKMNLAPNGSI